MNTRWRIVAEVEELRYVMFVCINPNVTAADMRCKNRNLASIDGNGAGGILGRICHVGPMHDCGDWV